MRSIAIVVGMVVLCAMSTSYARTKAPTVDDKLQAACYPDIQRLCKDAIPDEDKIRTCMEGKKSMISDRCVKAYNESQK